MTGIDKGIGRRDFLRQSGAGLGGFLASPRLGVLGVAVGALAAAGGARKDGDSAAGSASGAARRLLRAGEPVNSRGQAFGHDITGLAAIEAPASRPGSRYLLIVGHDRARPGCEDRIARKTTGLTALEIEFELGLENGHWRHRVSSSHNRRWDADSLIALDGARLGADGKAARVREEGEALGSIVAIEQTPWGTALAAERDGWIVEVNPLTGLAVRRFSLGRVGAVALRLNAQAGRPVEVYLLSQAHVFRFVSHQQFEPRRPELGHTVLTIGELSALAFDADAAGAGHWVPLTERDAKAGEWERVARDPRSCSRIPRALAPEDAREAYGKLCQKLAPPASRPEPPSFFAEHGEEGASLMVRSGRNLESDSLIGST